MNWTMSRALLIVIAWLWASSARADMLPERLFRV